MNLYLDVCPETVCVSDSIVTVPLVPSVSEITVFKSLVLQAPDVKSPPSVLFGFSSATVVSVAGFDADGSSLFISNDLSCLSGAYCSLHLDGLSRCVSDLEQIYRTAGRGSVRDPRSSSLQLA